MSLYKQCSEALDALIADPPGDAGGLFTEIDVVRKAAKRGWSDSMFKSALKQANQLCGTAYRARKLARFGPVDYQGNDDYGRIASKIAYAPADRAPDVWETPNGKFPKLMIEDDPLIRQGRKHGTNRNDLAPWNGQSVRKTTEKESKVIDPVEVEARTKQLEADLAAATRRAEEAEAEAARLRSHKVTVATNGDTADDTILKLLEDALDRIGSLEERERARERVYAD